MKDSATAKATMSYGGVTASGFFKFAANGDVVSFAAKRYYDRKGEATLEDWFIQTDPDSYTEFEGVRIPARSEVTWKLKAGDFTWFKSEVTAIHSNQVTD